MTSDGGYLSLTDVANGAEVRLSAVSNWRARHADFPRPHMVSGQEVFDRDEIAEWLQNRKIPQNRLKSDERPGTSYGDRLLLNIDATGRPAPERPNTGSAPRPQTLSWSKGLWSAMDHLRGAHDRSFALEYLLGLVYVKTHEPRAWQAVVATTEWSEVRATLSGVALSTTVGKAIPVFRALGQVADASLLEVIQLVDKIDLSSGPGPGSPGAQISDAILADLERAMGRRGGHFTPPGVAGFLVDLLEPNQSDQLYDPFCGSGELLVAAAEVAGREGFAFDGPQVHGQPSHDWSLLTSKMNLSLHGVEADISGPANALDDDLFVDRQFDVVLANPPFSMRLNPQASREWPFGDPPQHNADLAWLQHVVTKLKPGGRAAVIMPAGASFRGGREAHIRQKMVERGVVECVVGLPPQLFKYTAIPTMVWMLRGIDAARGPAEILFIDARELGELVDRTERQLSVDDTTRIADELRRWRERGTLGEFTGTAGFSRAVGHDEISRNDYDLTPGRYTGQVPEQIDTARVARELDGLSGELRRLMERAEQIQRLLYTKLDAAVAGRSQDSTGRSVSLGEVCDVLAGSGTVAKEGRDSFGIPLVLPRNIKENRIGIEDLDTVSPATARRMDRYQLIAGDIVTTRTGTLGRYGQVGEEQAGWLLGPGCVRFRPADEVDPDFLISYLTGRAALHWLTEHASGTAIRQVTTSTLRRMPLWLPSLPAQREIVQILEPFRAAAATHEEIGSAVTGLHDLLVSMLMAPGTTLRQG
ncbi:Type I restriction-modification system [Amycolatopsis camponoti]|uniref:Type I restriction-modification system n=1 Tax=Amycolatopsis camponoti TaxID=2606593 RepID=A0A6I8LZF4_9PSEU|nr:N-6 DNA methylase [Amycolatopsis camponoti]VVJ22870.1 Type I restriction-modification system [Amycolatopsis camponoti]